MNDSKIREALEWYADRERYQVQHSCTSYECFCTLSDAIIDEGERARRALGLLDKGDSEEP